MVGKTNAGGSGLNAGDLLCWYWGRKSTGAKNHPNVNVTAAINKDYFTYSDHTLTVIKAFTGTVYFLGSGTRNGTSGSSGAFALRLYFIVNNQTVVDKSNITYTGNGIPDARSMSFSVGDTITIEGYHTTNTYTTDFGYFITLDS